MLFKGDKLIIPESFKKFVLKQLHGGHSGLEKTLWKARRNVYWRGMQADITDYIESCNNCQKFKRSNCKEPLHSHRIAERPWELISADLFYENFRDYLVIIDSYSNWIEVAELKSKSIEEVIQIFKKIFTTLGIPDEILSDNNPFTSYKFHAFCKEYGIKHNPSSPLYPKSNGLAEKGVAIAKNVIRKSSSDEEVSLGLMEYKNSKLKGLDYTPSELMMSRQLKTNLPCSTERLKPKNVNHQEVKIQLKTRKEKSEKYYNQHAKPLPKIEAGENVMLQKKKIWVPARIKKDLGNNSYMVQDENNQLYRRNRIFLSKTKIPYKSITDHSLLIDNFNFKSDVVTHICSAEKECNPISNNTENNSITLNLSDVEQFYDATNNSSIIESENENLLSPCIVNPDDSSIENRTENHNSTNSKTTRFGRNIVKPKYLADFDTDF